MTRSYAWARHFCGSVRNSRGLRPGRGEGVVHGGQRRLLIWGKHWELDDQEK